MIKKLIGFALLELALIAGNPRVSHTLNDREEPIRIIRSTALSDEQKILELAKLLDQRILPANPISAKELDDYGRDLSQLVVAIAYLTHPIKSPATAPIIRRLIDAGAIDGFRNSKQVKNHLYVALGLAGGNPPEDVMLGFLNDGGISDGMLEDTLHAMAISGVPIRAIPRLLQLGQHNRSYIKSNSVGPSRPRRVFPIRSAAVECLTQLGVRVKKTVTNEASSGWKEQVSVTQFSVERRSLAGKLEQWILSNDESKWRPALESARSLPEPEVTAMLRGLKEKKDLPADKKRLLEGRQ